MPSNLTDLWEQALAALRSELSQPSYEMMLKHATPRSLDQDTLTIEVPNGFISQWVSQKHCQSLESSLSSMLDRDMKVKVTVANNASTDEVPALDAEAEIAAAAQRSFESSPAKGGSGSPVGSGQSTNGRAANGSIASGNAVQHYNKDIFNPKYTFDTFVIGSGNRLAQAASLAVAQSPGQAYNPLFIYGDVGLGKTHLMHAIGQFVQQNNPSLRVVYVSTETFTNEMIESIKGARPVEFRNNYRRVDLLLIDDIQFLAGKERTQEEFFHTFNALYEANKQIVISSDRPPKEIQTLEDRLRSRFEWGLICDIQTPDLETRIAILRRKAQMEGLQVDRDVILYIAERIEDNIRELEGALSRIVAYSSLRGEMVDLDFAKDCLKDILPERRQRPITISLIQEKVASHYDLTVDSLKGRKRTRAIAFPRQVAMYLSRELTDHSLPQIGEEFGGRDHTTVMYAHDKITNKLDDDSNFANQIRHLTREIKSS